MKRKLYILSFLVAFCAALFAQNVSDVAFYQEGKNIVVTYSLDKVANVSVQVSTDGGATYSAPLKHVSGDVGKDVSAGAKQIVWDVLSEYDSFTGDNVVFLVQAIGETHKYVDLGLPSGTLWAECNVGAKSPEEVGDYFAWGEITPKSTYSKKTYTMVDNPTVLDASHDAATANWGDKWRTPTTYEQEELHRECTWTWMTFHGKKGYRVTGKNGNSIFLPITRHRKKSSFGYWNEWTEYGSYWSSSLSDNKYVYVLMFRSDSKYISNIYRGYRHYGRVIRPVCSPAE